MKVSLYIREHGTRRHRLASGASILGTRSTSSGTPSTASGLGKRCPKARQSLMPAAPRWTQQGQSRLSPINGWCPHDLRHSYAPSTALTLKFTCNDATPLSQSLLTRLQLVELLLELFKLLSCFSELAFRRQSLIVG